MSFSSEVKNEIRNNRFTSKKRHSKINGSNVKNQTVLKAQMIDAFLQSGTVSDPEKSYHLEFVCGSEAEAAELRETMLAFGIAPGVMERKDRYVVYLKDSEAISAMLVILGATNAVLELENIMILKEMKEKVQRAVNCETANIRKTVSASVRQLEDIELIKQKKRVSELPEGLKQAAELRAEYPDATLSELSEKLPGVSKSGINHRFRRIAKLADELRAEENL